MQSVLIEVRKLYTVVQFIHEALQPIRTRSSSSLI